MNYTDHVNNMLNFIVSSSEFCVDVDFYRYCNIDTFLMIVFMLFPFVLYESFTIYNPNPNPNPNP